MGKRLLEDYIAHERRRNDGYVKVLHNHSRKAILPGRRGIPTVIVHEKAEAQDIADARMLALNTADRQKDINEWWVILGEDISFLYAHECLLGTKAMDVMSFCEMFHVIDEDQHVIIMRADDDSAKAVRDYLSLYPDSNLGVLYDESGRLDDIATFPMLSFESGECAITEEDDYLCYTGSTWFLGDGFRETMRQWMMEETCFYLLSSFEHCLAELPAGGQGGSSTLLTFGRRGIFVPTIGFLLSDGRLCGEAHPHVAGLPEINPAVSRSGEDYPFVMSLVKTEPELYALYREASYIAKSARDITKIWNSVHLEKDPAIQAFVQESWQHAKMSVPPTSVTEWGTLDDAAKAIVRFLDEEGVSTMLDAYFAGVPIEDVVA